MPKVSIITAAFSDQYIDQTKDSILRQTHDDWEWIIVNDASPAIDNWFNKFKLSCNELDWVNLEEKIIYVRLSKNQGRYGLPARNVGITLASGKYIAILDDDNHWKENDYLEELVKVSEETNKIAFSDLYLIGKKPGSTYERPKKTDIARHNIDLGNPLYKREFFKKYGLLSDSKNKIMWDFDKIKEIMNGEGGKEAFIKAEKTLVFLHKRY